MGAVGTIAAYALRVSGKSEVTCVVRSKYDAVIKSGYNIDSVDYGQVKNFHPDHIERTTKDAMANQGPFDYVLITMKNIPDIFPIEDVCAECYSKDSTFILLENGIGIERPFFKKFPDGRLISGVSMIGATLYGDTVKQVGPDFVTFGPYINMLYLEDEQISKCKEFCDLYDNEHNQVKYVFNVKKTRWTKLVYNATMNTTCAVTGVDSGRLDLFGGYDTIVTPAMKEVLAIAKADGVELPDSLIEYMLRAGGEAYYPPSMLIDVRKGNYIEYQTIIANVLTYAKEYSVPAPTLTMLSNILHVYQMKTMEKKGRFELPKVRPPRSEHYQIKFKY